MRENLVYKKENNLKVYVINLKKDTERLKSISPLPLIADENSISSKLVKKL